MKILARLWQTIDPDTRIMSVILKQKSHEQDDGHVTEAHEAENSIPPARLEVIV